MVCAVSPVPQIVLSPAPPQEPTKEPFSPFSRKTFLEEPDSPRPALLSPPPTLSSRSPRQLSPLRPNDSSLSGQGIERERFEALLRSSRERNAALGGKKSPDLRKEIALKVHKSKQVERRALFLSKILAPPSPTATLLPKTPPESPAIFHYSLPSPGLESPIAVFEDLALENPQEFSRHTWVEQVDYRVSDKTYIASASRGAFTPQQKHLPSLDEITARLSFGHVSANSADKPRLPTRLPSFLGGKARPPESAKPRRPLPAAVGRLHFPVRPPTPPSPSSETMEIPFPTPCFPPPSPSAVPAPQLQILTTVVPRTPSKSPTEFTEDNLKAFSSLTRARAARDMLSRIRCRTLPPNAESSASTVGSGKDEERKLRRHSAPADLPFRERRRFAQPPLNLPGAF